MTDKLAGLRALPRLRLAHLPTPLEAMPRLGAWLGVGSLWVKRDDCTGLGLGGTYALISLGLVLAFRATATLNFAHGELMVFPAFIVGKWELSHPGQFWVPAVVGLLVDLAAADAERLPETERQHAVIAGISLPRLAIAAGQEALPAVLAALT